MTEPSPERPTPAPVPTPALAPMPALTLPPPAPDALPFVLTLGLAGLAVLLTKGANGDFGLNVLLLCGALVGSLLLVLRRRDLRPKAAALVVLALGLLCALGLVVRDGPLMSWLNVLGLLTALTFGLAFVHLPGLSRLSLGGTLLTLIWSGVRGFSGLIASGLRVPWGRLRFGRSNGRARSVGIGLLLSVPLLLVFGELLSGADTRFGEAVSRLFRLNLGDLPATLFQLIVWAFVLGGPVYAALLAGRAYPEATAGGGKGYLGLIELGLPLLSLSLLFCAYLGVQASYLFGSGLSAGLTYSEYARRGFGELSAVALLTLAVLLLAHALLRRDLRARLAYRLLSAAVLLPLALLILSAYNRLSLYVAAYGLSESRVLGAVFLAWVTLSLLAYAVLLWRGGLERFAYFSLISGLSLTVGLNVVNPGRLIASVNVSRDVGGVQNDVRTSRQQADAGQLVRLGADTVPVILAHLDALTGPGFDPTASYAGPVPPTREVLLKDLRRTYASQAPDWRSWNWARWRARQLILEIAP